MPMVMRVINFIWKHLVKIVSILLALLFIYAAASKLFDFEAFQVQLAQSPLLSAYAGVISYGILVIEFLVAIMLLIPNSNKVGLYASIGLMSAFTLYIYLILNYSDFVPCSCGGILEKLGWTEHLIFNIFFLVLSFIALIVLVKKIGRSGLKELGVGGLIIVISCLVVIGLFRSSEHIIKSENSFIRRFLQHPVLIEKTKDLKVNSFYLAGIEEGILYLGNISAPLIVTTIDTSLTVFSQMHTIIDKKDYNFRNVKLQVRKPYFYVFDGTVPIIYRGHLGDSIARTLSYKDAFFNQMVILDSTRFAIRTQRGSDRSYTLALLDLSRNSKVKLKSDVLQGQIDGVFSVDGSLISNSNATKLVYTYVYRNQFIVMDSTLRIDKRLQTIDTTTHAKITITKLSDGSKKMGAPPFTVNKRSVIYGDLLFNESNLKGQYEPSEAWRTSSIIDVYNTARQQYMGSFYIDHKKGEALSSWLVNGNDLYAIVGNELRRYKIRGEAFN
ncbi:DoxX family protein [Chryseobacterium sp. JUb7]|uniref:DoxX family protein n=1 Tax=Chryseobacterium sp. JUb7 TaxID=2940599 RepID=UPI0021679B12|nr:MauE/DoxX family redox-associated membrane protein [Chryseobacterium sp. JUb7]MCS3531202.1 putative membrane protein YphA (DoxX/SURF4 family) [Chryseobacterium sp. JUb7]